MTDQEWFAMREKWREKVENGNLMCNEDMIPFAVLSGKPWQWVSRHYVERMQEIASDPALQASLKKIYDSTTFRNGMASRRSAKGYRSWL